MQVISGGAVRERIECIAAPALEVLRGMRGDVQLAGLRGELVRGVAMIGCGGRWFWVRLGLGMWVAALCGKVPLDDVT